MSPQTDLFGMPARLALHRLFFALFPDAAEQQAIRSLAERLPSVRSQLRWVRPERYHLTLHYLGESDQRRQEHIDRAIAAVADIRAESFELVLDHLKVLGNPRNPALTLAASAPPPALLRFWQELQQRLIRAGFKQHLGQGFIPHLTLGYTGPRPALDPVPAVRLRPAEFRLIHSIHGEPEYEVLGHWPIGR